MPRFTHGIAAGNRLQGTGLLVSGNHMPPFRSDEVRYQRGSHGASPGVVQGAPLLPPDAGTGGISARRTFRGVDAMAIASSLVCFTAAIVLERAHAPQHMVDVWEFAGGLIGVGWTIIRLIPWPRRPRGTPATSVDVEPQALPVHDNGTGLSALNATED